MSNLTGIQLEGEWIRNVRVLHNILSYIGRSTKCNFNLEVAGHLPETTILNLNNLGLVTLVRINCLLQVERWAVSPFAQTFKFIYCTLIPQSCILRVIQPTWTSRHKRLVLVLPIRLTGPQSILSILITYPEVGESNSRGSWSWRTVDIGMFKLVIQYNTRLLSTKSSSLIY